MQIKNLYKRFSGKRDDVLFENLSFLIPKSKIVALFGPSGCGKSSILKILAGLDTFYQGEISGCHHSTRIDYIPQQNSLLPWLNVRDNIEFGLKIMMLDRNKRRSISSQVLHELDLERYADFFPKQLSGGLAQMVAFGRSLANGTEILFMDEPFSSVDIFVRDKLQDKIKNIQRKKNITIVLVTHQIDEAIYLADIVMTLTSTKPTTVFNTYHTTDIKDKSSSSYYKMQSTIMSTYQNGT